MRPVPLSPAVAATGYVALALQDTLLAASSSPARRRWRLVTKPLLMPALATAFTSATPRPDVHRAGLRRGTVAAQALSGAGDIALLSRSEPAFLAGLGSFFGAHVAYTAAFASAARPLADRTHLGGVAAGAAMFGAMAPVMGRAAARESTRLRGPVVAYAGILSSMFAASTRLDDTVPQDARRLVVAGSALFLLSDTILATRRFLLHDASPLGDAAVMATYTAGQGLLALGVNRSLRARVDG